MQLVAYASVAIGLLGGGASTVFLAHLLVDRPMLGWEATWALMAVCGNAVLLIGGVFLRIAQVRQRTIPITIVLASGVGGIAAALGQANVALHGFRVRSEHWDSALEDPVHWAWAILGAAPPLVLSALLAWWWPGPMKPAADPERLSGN